MLGEKCLDSELSNIHHETVLAKGTFQFGEEIYLSPQLPCSAPTHVWLAKWCKIHKVYIHSHSMLLLLFTNILENLLR